jgi:ABC-2 type transport system ATP-binding protein
MAGSDHTVYVEVDDTDAARRVLSDLAGIVGIEDEQDGLVLALEGIDRPALVAALVHAGIGVQTVTVRRQLEDAFIGLVGEEHAR